MKGKNHHLYGQANRMETNLSKN